MTPEEEYEYVQQRSLELLVEKRGRDMTTFEIARAICNTTNRMEPNHIMEVLDEILEEYYEHRVVRKNWLLKDDEDKLKKYWNSNIHYI